MQSARQNESKQKGQVSGAREPGAIGKKLKEDVRPVATKSFFWLPFDYIKFPHFSLAVSV